MCDLATRIIVLLEQKRRILFRDNLFTYIIMIIIIIIDFSLYFVYILGWIRYNQIPKIHFSSDQKSEQEFKEVEYY